MKYLLVLFAAMAITFNVNAAKFSKAEKSEVQAIVHDYLLDHPELLMKMSQELQQQQEQQRQQKALLAIKANKIVLLNPGDTQVAGNPRGSVTLVEFFDYQCVHCTNMHRQGVITDLIKHNADLRVVYKEFPIFGPTSIYAAKAAMAANQQGHYLQMRNAIFNTGAVAGALRTEEIDALAQRLGLNMQQYHKAINARALQLHIEENYQLAKALGIEGTPSFVISPTPTLGDRHGKSTFISGLVGAKQLQQAIDAAK